MGKEFITKNADLHNSDIQPQNERAEIEIVELGPDDWQKLQSLKLRSLDQEPIAFEDPEKGRARYLAREEVEWRSILSGKLTGRAGEYVNIFAKGKGEIVGMVAAAIQERQSSEEKTATIQHMYVDRDWRGQKIGKELLQAMLSKLKQRGDLKKTELAVVATQLPAIDMYKGLGFKEVGRTTTKRGEDNYEEIKMELRF